MPAHADRTFDDCEKVLRQTAKTDAELGRCGGEWLAREEVRLKVAWHTAFVGAGGAKNDEGKASLDEQRAWIAFKDRACRSFDLQDAGTPSRFHDANICRAEIIEDRIAELSGDLRGKGLR